MSIWDGVFDFAKDQVTDLIPGSIDDRLLAGVHIGGGGGQVRCPGQPSDDLVQDMLSNAPASEIAALKATFDRAGLGSKFTVDNPYQIAYEAYGGNNCNWDASSNAKAIKAQFDRMMQRYGRPVGGETGVGNYEAMFDAGPQFLPAQKSGLPGWAIPAAIVAALVAVVFLFSRSAR
jgi:hypothetical protein